MLLNLTKVGELVQMLYLVFDVFHVDIHKHTKIFYSTSSMEFGIKCVTVCACDWLLFVFLQLYSVYNMIRVLIIWVGCD